MNKKYIVSMTAAIIAISAIAVTPVNAFTLGQRGGDVADLQISLIEAGFDIPAITSGAATPGYFGVQTQKALAARDASKPSPQLGAVASPDIMSPYFSFGGVRFWGYRDTSLTRAASTTCSFQLPTTATTTFVGAGAKLDTIASTTMFEIGYDATSAYATTTLIVSKTITAATQDSVVASTSPADLGSLTPPRAFAPGGFVNYKIGGGSIAGTNDPAGACSLVVREI